MSTKETGGPAWDHKDVWHRRGTDFLIEVRRHLEPSRAEVSGWVDEEGPHRWCVYAYIYPKHPYFGEFKGPSMWQDATGVMPLHGGCTYLEYPQHEGVVTSVKVGCDYNHLHDGFYTRMATKEEARAVFNDAEELFDWLKARQS